MSGAQRLRPPLLVADLFCGAGGSSSGARKALHRQGRTMQLVAVNHWPVAIETHSLNHPEARHFCVNLDAANPRELVPEGRLDLLMASPECTHHSRARGGRPVNDQSRMSAWHVVRWATELRVRCILIENVPEFEQWGPVNATTGRPLASRRGEYFRAFVKALRGIGYKVEWRVLNAADFGDATTRERLFMLARCDGKPLRWPVPTHSREGCLFGSHRWRGAREVIDWSLPGQSIFNRKRPLAPKTLARIAEGFRRQGKAGEPFLVVLRRHCAGRSIDLPLPTITAGGTHLGLATPFLLSQASGGAPRPVTEPVPTIPCGGAHAMIAPYYGSGSGETCKTVEHPLPTVTTKARFGLVEPFLVPQFGEREGQTPRTHSLDAPLPAVTSHGAGALVLPEIDGVAVDIRFRMLAPHELARAMGFADEELGYEFAGTKTDVIRQIGNAVPVNTAAALVAALMGKNRL